MKREKERKNERTSPSNGRGAGENEQSDVARRRGKCVCLLDGQLPLMSQFAI